MSSKHKPQWPRDLGDGVATAALIGYGLLRSGRGLSGRSTARLLARR